MPYKKFTAVGLAAVACVAVAACSSSGSGSKSSSGSNPLSPSASNTVVVGSANFPEDELLAQIYADALQSAGVKVTTKFNIGAREVYYPEVVKGAISIIPEYNGALLTTSVDKTSTATSTAEVDAALKAKLPSSVKILNSSAAQDKDSITVTQANAAKYHLKSISDLSSVAKSWVIGGPSEFQTRADGIVGLKKVYGLTFKSFSPLDESGPITLSALTERQGPGGRRVHHHAADHHGQAPVAVRPEEHVRRPERDCRWCTRRRPRPRWSARSTRCRPS